MKIAVKPCLLASLLLLAACNSGLEHELPGLTTLATPTTLRVPIIAASDDAEEVSGGSMQLSGGLLDLRAKDGVVQSVGLRFQKVTIPQGAKVTAARIEVKGGLTDTGTVNLQVRGEAADNAATFSTALKNLSTRSKTTASASWNPNSWVQGGLYKTGELTPIVQEVVSRSGWRSGNALAFSIVGTGGTAERVAIAYGGAAANVPVLVVTYEGGGEDTTPTPEPAPEPVAPTPPPPAPVPEPQPLPAPDGGSMADWHARLEATISNPRYSGGSTWMDPKVQAATGNLYKLGRDFNNYTTSLMLAYRETGDHSLAEQLETVMNIAKNELADTNGDGYLNWLYFTKTDASSDPYLGTDLHVMDEMLTHSMVAAAAYTLKEAGFSSSAAFWTDYLQNDFEAKWRARNNKPSGYPFIKHFLLHPTTQFIRYNFYMYKLTGDSSYYGEAKRLAEIIRRQMRPITTPGGEGYVWDHQVKESGPVGTGCQPTVYIKYTTQALADLATADSSLFGSDFMKRVANTMAYKVLLNTDGTQMAGNICGSGTYGSLYTFAQYPYTQTAAWDDSNRLETAAVRAYAATERWNLSSPVSYTIPANMVFTLGR